MGRKAKAKRRRRAAAREQEAMEREAREGLEVLEAAARRGEPAAQRALELLATLEAVDTLAALLSLDPEAVEWDPCPLCR